VVLLPAQTRYEQRGGGTETSTERYILFSPEIPGRRVGESRPEWEILMELAKRVSPDRSRLIHFDSAEAVRMEIAKHVPFYEGIQKLRKKGEAVQWGGRILCRDGRFGTADGKARFSPVRLPENAIPEGRFHLSTRRGKQFNSMVDKSYDPLTGARRDEIFLNPEDAGALALREGDPILLRSDAGELRGRVKLMPIQTRNVQAYWPECNGLLKRERREPLSGIPDYNAFVEVIALSEDDAGH
jgi:anaerobic selenocysteine-containing dehydrogenase